MIKPDGPRPPPLKARLWRYKGDPTEKLVLQAVAEHVDESAMTVYVSLATLATFTGLSIRTVRRCFSGWYESRTKEHHRGLKERRVLIQRSKGKPEDRMPAIYSFNEAALEEDPAVMAILEQRKQRVLPGFKEPAAPSYPVHADKSSPFLPTPVRVTVGGINKDTLRSGCPETPVSLTVVPPTDPGQGDRTPSGQPDRTPHPPSGQPDRRSTVSLTAYPLSLDLSSPIEGATSTTSWSPEEINQTLKSGLRDILPDLDDRAISQLWVGCKTHAPDCTVDEVLHFAWQKSGALRRAESPAGMLISIVPRCFEGTLLASYREKKRREQEREQQQRAQAQLEEAETKEFQWRMEIDRQQAERELQELPRDEYQRLEKKAAAELLSQYPQARTWEDFEQKVAQKMLRERQWKITTSYQSSREQLLRDKPQARHWPFNVLDATVREEMKAKSQ